MGERSAALDAVRVIGMVAVVTGHIWINAETRQWIYTWQLPLFFILSGYLWGGRRTFTGEASIRARTLLVPYLAWFVIIAAVTWTSQLLLGTFDIRVALGQTWGGSFQSAPFWAFWFPTALFVALMVYAVASRLALHWQWVIAVLLLIITAYVPGAPMQMLPLAIGQGLGAFIFVVAGRTLRHSQSRIGHDRVVGPVMLAAGIALILVFPASFIDVKSLHFGIPVVGILTAVLVGGGMIVTAGAYLQRMPHLVNVGITRLSLASLVVMFVHVPIAYAFGWLEDGPSTGLVLTIAASWALGLALICFPRAWFLTGARGAAPTWDRTPGRVTRRRATTP